MRVIGTSDYRHGRAFHSPRHVRDVRVLRLRFIQQLQPPLVSRPREREHVEAREAVPSQRDGRVPDPGTHAPQFEALLTAAMQSTNRCDFALVTMLGLLGRRIFEATDSDTEDLGEEHGHRILRVHGKGDKVVLVPLPPAVGRHRAVHQRSGRGTDSLNSRGTRMD